MALWYNDGTVAVTNGSTTVTGTGTAWGSNTVSPGDAFHGPDGRAYPVASIVSDTEITLQIAYDNSTATGADYSIQPTRGLVKVTLDKLSDFNASLQDYIDGALRGRFDFGSQGSPGVAFLGDLDTGLRRPAANDVALVAGGIDQIRASGGSASGAAVQSGDLDVGSGKLIKVGGFGVGKEGGVPAPNDDANDCVVPGFNYRFSTGGANTPFANPYGSTLQVFSGTGGNRLQQLFVATTGEQIHLRSSTDSGVAWSDWVAVMPERFSNSNGEYVQFSDGTLICTRSCLIDLNSDAVQSFAYAASFLSGTPDWVSFSQTDLTGTVGDRNARLAGLSNLGCRAATTFEFRANSNFLVAQTTNIDAVAIGRWR